MAESLNNPREETAALEAAAVVVDTSLDCGYWGEAAVVVVDRMEMVRAVRGAAAVVVLAFQEVVSISTAAKVYSVVAVVLRLPELMAAPVMVLSSSPGNGGIHT